MIVDRIPILSVITFLPLLGAVVIAFLPRERPDLARWTALAAALLTWLFSLALLVGYLPGDKTGGFQYIEQVDWIPAFGIQYKLGVDGLSLVLVVLTTTLSWISILASFGPIKERVKEY
ncbi:MAG TPA: NADH-quinone oxidoreductase subunit M, partial [Candidatus Binatia bacterium]|nr:NADH-quinone oxidoreductase subunit M [Candidatus Binatia bacterium]